LIRHYYVVPGEADPELARRAALRRAVAPGERAVRGGRDLDARTTELRRMVRDPLGARAEPRRLGCVRRRPEPSVTHAGDRPEGHRHFPSVREPAAGVPDIGLLTSLPHTASGHDVPRLSHMSPAG